MTRSWMGWPALGVAVLALSVAPAGARGPAAPFAGDWTVTVFADNQEITFALVKIEDKDGKPQARMVSGFPAFKDAPIEDLKADAQSLHFRIKARNTFTVAAYAPQGDDKPKKLLGSVQIGGETEPAALQRTEQTELNLKEAMKPLEGAKEVGELARETDAQKQQEGLKELQKKYGDKPAGLLAGRVLLGAAGKSGASADEVRPVVDQYIKSARAYGPEMEQQATFLAARELLSSDKGAALAAEYARQAEKQLGANPSATQVVPVLKVLAKALNKTGKADEAKGIDERLSKLEAKLDEEFEKTAVPFQPEKPAGRKNQSDRVVLLELFTGAQCPPCVSADIAFDAALKAYKPSEVALLQYHLHIPGPDPLTNKDSEARQEYYGDEVQGTPTMFLNGKTTPPMGGFTQHGEERYGALRKLLDEALEKDPQARLKLDVQRSGDRIDLQADVADLKKTGEKVHLRFVLVEDVVRYAGRNRQRLHHHVVRAYPGGAEGIALKEKTGQQKASVDLGQLRKKLEEYLAESNKRRPFLDEARPLDLQHLKVVAFIQDDDSKEILQAAQMDVPAK